MLDLSHPPAVKQLPYRIAKLQNAIVRELNNIHIFIRQALPLLEDARATHAASTHKKDRRYYVPSVGRTKFAKRTDHELKQIYELFTAERLYESFLITAIAEFETFLARVLREIIQEYPPKLSVSVPGISACRTVPVELVLGSADLDEVLEHTITDHLNSVFYAAPKAYLEYLSKIAGTKVTDPAFDDYIELKATRDLLVHNSRVVNSTYLNKAGQKARGAEGDRIAVDSGYFDRSFATLKRISGIIKRDVETTFPTK